MPSAQPLRYYINLTTGQAMSISAFLDGDTRFFQIKVSEFIDLEPEYTAYRNAWADFPSYVPRPLGYIVREHWRAMISEGIAHKPLPPKLIASYGDTHRVGAVSELLKFFAVGQQRAQVDGASSHAALFDAVAEYFAAGPLAALAERWLKHAVHHEAHALPLLAQHGDFVLNNLAVSGTKLVVFDWEDYGRTTLQGLDLATLAISVWGSSPEMIRDLCDPNIDLPPSMAAFLRRACGHCGIEFEVFRLQLPLYVLVFLYLKRNYGSGIRERLSNLLRLFSA